MSTTRSDSDESYTSDDSDFNFIADFQLKVEEDDVHSDEPLASEECMGSTV